MLIAIFFGFTLCNLQRSYHPVDLTSFASDISMNLDIQTLLPFFIANLGSIGLGLNNEIHKSRMRPRMEGYQHEGRARTEMEGRDCNLPERSASTLELCTAERMNRCQCRPTMNREPTGFQTNTNQGSNNGTDFAASSLLFE